MELMTSLVLGLMLGMRHALDADHVVAVSTIVSEYRNPLRAIWIGVSWGLGHTTTLFLAGIGIVFVGMHIPERLALYFELAVGLMLVFLGLQVFWTFRRKKVHLHPHQEEGHRHFHSHVETPGHAHHRGWSLADWSYFLIAGITPEEARAGRLPGPGKPFFRIKSYVVGIVHGMAGSAALMLLVLASIRNPLAGLSYILVFGLGSVAAMGFFTIFLSLPFSLSARFPSVNRVVRAVAGVSSIAFGSFLMYEIGFVEGLFL